MTYVEIELSRLQADGHSAWMDTHVDSEGKVIHQGIVHYLTCPQCVKERGDVGRRASE